MAGTAGFTGQLRPVLYLTTGIAVVLGVAANALLALLPAWAPNHLPAPHPLAEE